MVCARRERRTPESTFALADLVSLGDANIGLIMIELLLPAALTALFHAVRKRMSLRHSRLVKGRAEKIEETACYRFGDIVHYITA